MTMNVSISSALARRAITLGAILAVAALTGPLALSAQSTSGWQMPRTAWGDPNLQGDWTNATLTPFQRRGGQGPILTAEQVLAIESGQAEAVAERAAPSDPNRPPPPAGGTNPICIDGPTSCYNEVYRQPGETVAYIDGEPRSSLVTYPADGRVPDRTDEAGRRIEAFNASRADFGPFDHPELRPLAERCLVSFGSSAGPPMLPNYWYNNNYTIVQNADYVMINIEMVHDLRIIRLGEPKLLPDGLYPWFGDSWGHWEGNTLVVETTNFNPDHWFQGAPPSKERKITERFTRVGDETILYEFSIDDPVIYTGVWGGEIPFTKLEGQVYEYACHEANYSLGNVLSGARYQERREGGR